MRVSQNRPQFQKISSTPTKQIILKYPTKDRDFNQYSIIDETDPTQYHLSKSGIPERILQDTKLQQVQSSPQQLDQQQEQNTLDSPYRPIFRRKIVDQKDESSESSYTEISETIPLETSEIPRYEPTPKVEKWNFKGKPRQNPQESSLHFPTPSPAKLSQPTSRNMQKSLSPLIAPTSKISRIKKLKDQELDKETEDFVQRQFYKHESVIQADFINQQTQKMDDLLSKIDNLLNKSPAQPTQLEILEPVQSIPEEPTSSVNIYQEFQHEIQSQNLTQNQVIQQQKSMLQQNQILQEQMLQMQKQILYLQEQKTNWQDTPQPVITGQLKKHSSAIQQSSICELSQISVSDENIDVLKVTNTAHNPQNTKTITKQQQEQVCPEQSKIVKQPILAQNQVQSRIPGIVARKPIKPALRPPQKIAPRYDDTQDIAFSPKKVQYQPYATMEDPYAVKHIRTKQTTLSQKPANPTKDTIVNPIDYALKSFDEKLSNIQSQDKRKPLNVYDEEVENLKKLNLYFQQQIDSFTV
ncbi:hypothetical protein SS50377_27848 [Spironucleus salmonicida]|uniref:Uncharacterized protein n=1 Tax=Spironucleus salmonicida TaxID=348837 RepID=V6LW32_9EUKA|nr:hypothetical protein SS50377_27848 [Spironucleus salmonicida]|eukprot:EST48837.1 Hypothetical protein SS50377_10933 [Spironucleus salmonicida]